MENEPASLLVPLGKALSRISPFCSDRSVPATPKRAHYCALIAFS